MNETPSPGPLLPRRRLRRRPRFSGPSFNRLIPNLMTLVGLCAGLTAIRLGIEEHFGGAAKAILLAAVIDGLDGRLARLLKAVSRFGAEFDSLTDFLCFGVAPAFVIYLWSLHGLHGYGFVPPLIFAVCMALRLARFNANLDTVTPPYTYNFFTGVPAPAGALLALMPLFVGLEAREMSWSGLERVARFPLIDGALLIGTAFLLISTLPVWSFKNFKVPAKWVLPLLLGTGLYAAFLIADPWAALVLAGLLYLAMLPFSARSFRRLREEAEGHLPEALAPETAEAGAGLEEGQG
jgi:CDP-diacylglycerol--serine O-phosphatidyltransferase